MEADDYDCHATKASATEELDVIDGPMPSKQTSTEPTSLESLVSTDLCSDWIGTRRRKPSLDMGPPPVLGRSDSLIIVFENESSNFLHEPANETMVDGFVHGLMTVGEDEWTIDYTSSGDHSQSKTLLLCHMTVILCKYYVSTTA